MIERTQIHDAMRSPLLEHRSLINGNESLDRTNFLGKYKSNLVMRADALIRTALDKIFKDSPALAEADYHERVTALCESKEQRHALAQTFDTVTAGPPFSPGMKFYAPDLLTGTLDAMRATMTAQPSAKPATPSAVRTDERPVDTSPAGNRLRDPIRSFFASLPEMRESNLKYNLIQSSVDRRIDGLTNIACGVLLAESAQPAADLSTQLAAMRENDSPLVQALSAFLNTHVGEYPRSIFTLEGNRMVANEAAQRYAQGLCDHLGKGMQVTRVEAAAAGLNAPATPDLVTAVDQQANGPDQPMIH